MRTTATLLSRNFLGRSELTVVAVNLEAIKGATEPKPLYDFNTADNVQDCIVMTDKTIGGFSESNFDFQKSTNANTSASTKPNPNIPSAYARFHGNISTRLPDDRPNIERTGFAGFRTPDQRPTAFGRSMWDIDPYIYLAMRIKSDGRKYFVNVQTESVEPSDLHQHRLFANRPGQWETLLIRWNDFVRTNHGFAVEPQTEMLRQKVLTVGVGLTDRVEGPFELCIEKVWATNDPSEMEVTEEQKGEDPPLTGHLRNKKGEIVRW
ncbi:putative complex I intermediate-associated protein CIA30 precursor, mitochondrial [Fusarium austroafricanum]|uniref:Putative complex I intermediate-associated protein CIA30, mitochondrial n=1 Tax=Fusarium austroafricanum TaxID=2364996 RepID=A0A8H4JHZ9_9HYPO|nr:putative complex I intermediate-associated protein CIA30 precursor, mitochondrial [Fusarium austroafricanum]